MQIIYLDNASTTQVDEDIAQVALDMMKKPLWQSPIASRLGSGRSAKMQNHKSNS
jgi:cysteine sulfinate desulfinase/cysteine desulfurase-like protein